MFGNVLAATLRNLARNRLYAAISIGGLAVGMAAALLTALFVHDELAFDRFIPGHDRIFVMFTYLETPGRAPTHFSRTDPRVAALFKLDFPQADKVARYRPSTPGVRSATLETNETIAWVDPDFFAILALPALTGDASAAIQRTDGVVLTRAAARRYFGRDAPIGETLQFGRRISMRVGAVIADLPGASNIQTQIFASGRAAASQLTAADKSPPPLGSYRGDFRTYVRLHDPQGAAAINAATPAFLHRRLESPGSAGFQGRRLVLTPITEMHMQRDAAAEVHPGSSASVFALATVAALILLAAAANFVNLQTARGAGRAIEVGVRKASGATRGRLVLQFIGESVIYAVLAFVLALALTELALPGLDAVVGRRIPFLYWRDPAMIALAIGLTAAVGLLAGAYPAMVLSSFRPAGVLKGEVFQRSGSGQVRRGLLVLQFTALIGLLLGVLTVYAQTRFAMTSAIGLDKEQMVQVAAPGCRGAFVSAVRALPGVARSACSSTLAVGAGDINTRAKGGDGRDVYLGVAPIDYGFFEAYGVKPLAGRFPSPANGGDGLADNAPAEVCAPPAAVFNASAARAFGFANPQRMVGAVVRVSCGDGWQPVRVMGVAPDIPFDLTASTVKPTYYPVNPRALSVLSLKLRADQVPATLAAIDRAWARSAPPNPIRRRFFDEFLRTVYADLISQGWLLGVLAGVAICLTGLGLFGLAAFTTGQRTKEIGVRKAMGASTADILGLLLWSLTRPVAWACAIAMPLSWWLLDRWLHGFSARIDLSPWLFLAVGAAALGVSALTVGFHAWRSARTVPAMALRYE